MAIFRRDNYINSEDVYNVETAFLHGTKRARQVIESDGCDVAVECVDYYCESIDIKLFHAFCAGVKYEVARTKIKLDEIFVLDRYANKDK